MDHLAIPVSDQECSRHFYETYLGFASHPPRCYYKLLVSRWLSAQPTSM